MNLELNLLSVIVLVVMIFNMVEGYKKGMVREIISFVSLVITCVVVVILGTGLTSYLDGDMIKLVVMVILLGVIGIVRHLLGVVFFSAKVISKLPIVSWVDKLLGIVVGILETVLILWTIYTFIMLMHLGMIGQQILTYTEESPILTWLYQNNYLAYLVEQISAKLNFLPL